MTVSVRLAIVGATGEVGNVMQQVVAERDFPFDTIKFLASERSVGKPIEFKGETYHVELLAEGAFTDVDIVLSSTPGSVSKEFSPIAAAEGAVVVDNSSAWRMDPETPLVVPEVNPDAVQQHKGIIANPNCSTIQMVMCLKPIHDAAGLRRVIVSTYQSVSGAGHRGLLDLDRQMEADRTGQPPVAEKFDHPILDNCLPHIDDFVPGGYTKEELKMVDETRKILGIPDLPVCPTAVRVPVHYSHSESICVETEKKLTADEARELLAGFPGITVVDAPAAARQYIYAQHPLNRSGTVQEVGKAALFLATDDSAFTTGSVLECDGGVTLGY